MADSPPRPRAPKVPLHGAASVRSVERAIDILRILSFNSATHGMRFLDLQMQTNLSKATLHRLLGTLMAQGLVERAAGSNLYYLGLDFLDMSERAVNRLDIRAIARPYLVRISKRTGDTSHLVIRSGLEAVYIDREEGSFPVRALTASIGTRRPLGIGSAGLALLASLPDIEIDEVLRRNSRRLTKYRGSDLKTLRSMVHVTRSRGWAINDGKILKGMYGIGVAIVTHDHRPIAALSVSANASRMQPDHQREIVVMLKSCAREIANSLAEGAAG